MVVDDRYTVDSIYIYIYIESSSRLFGYSHDTKRYTTGTRHELTLVVIVDFTVTLRDRSTAMAWQQK